MPQRDKKRPSDEAVDRYVLAIHEVQMRMDLAVANLERGEDRSCVEPAALHLRFALEGLALSSIVAHQHEMEPLSKSLRTLDADKIVKRVRSINPNWWPQPVDKNMEPVARGLVETAWGSSCGECSKLLHAQNPLRPTKLDLASCHASLVNISMAQLIVSYVVDLGGGYMLRGNVTIGPGAGGPKRVDVGLLEDTRITGSPIQSRRPEPHKVDPSALGSKRD